ncbi:hypothetical protein NSK_004324 [Nannochloropsis salina CCMP1776]|uniref:Uncharacterized protein n=1 Tax=Nannochloropsis salina CCMP1776 TaxID=1027361 RepID=A0A4D9D2T5_9STRA|nr:hypothetical protein NSK_004324 [Nannochloropsis salina CCMP1776]|eukprot:TFJ84333.1 hypothetical protein NSK_004324 [Nannochloropsis salina CCMP1776]
MFKRFVYKSGLLLKGTAGAINEPTLSSVQAATAGLIVTAAYQTIQIKESRRSMTFSTQKKDGGKIASNKPLSVVLQEFEASLDANKMLRSCSKRQRMLFPLHRVHGDLDAKKDSVSAYVSFGALTTSESFRKLLNMSKRCNDALQPLLLNG